MGKVSVVTGGSGFLGSHLCDKLLDIGHDVLCIDNFVSGSRRNVEHLKTNPNFTLIHHDVSKEFETKEKIDYIFHMASPASPNVSSPIGYQNIPIKTILANTVGAYNFLSLAKRARAKFLLASTSEIYGDPLEHPQKETYFGNVNPIGVRSCYDESKRAAEALTMAFFRTYNSDVRIVRIFNTYGPRMRMDDGRAVPNFIQQALEGRAITIYGNGSQTRSFCYVSDLIDGICSAMFKDGTKGDVFNLGNPRETSVSEIAKTISRIVGTEYKVAFDAMPEDDPVRRKPDITKATSVLGFKPKVDLEEGLRNTIEWFKSNALN